MSGHTPGLWTVERGAFGFYLTTVFEGERVRLAYMPVEEMNAETEANAKLMAAGPEMLKALQLAMGALMDETFSVEQWDRCINAVDAAIAKAGGEAVPR